MAVNQTLTFGSVTSSTYNIYISGEGVFDAPKRDTKIVTIPGRNGDFAIDQGRFENITVTYPAFYQATSLATFAQNLANFRAAMCSQIGYQRLTDTINSTEYRQALFIDGINFTPAKDDTFATFDLVFNCKPQRWLTTGETQSTVNINLTNPTPFNASPLFECTGTGSITITNHVTSQVETITVDSTQIGTVSIADALTVTKRAGQTFSYARTIDTSSLNSGNAFTAESIKASYIPSTPQGFTADTITSISGDATAYISGASFIFDFGDLAFTFGTSATKTASATLNFTKSGNSGTKSVTVSVAYNGSNTITITGTNDSATFGFRMEYGVITGISSKTVSPIYIDCENGLCWGEYSGNLVNANNSVTLPTNLPILWGSVQNDIAKTGAGFTAKVTPRWWRV